MTQDAPTHEDRVGLSLVALALERGMLRGGGFQVLVTSTELLPGGVHVSREEGVECAVGLLEGGGGIEGDKDQVRLMLGMMYDELVKLVEAELPTADGHG